MKKILNILKQYNSNRTKPNTLFIQQTDNTYWTDCIQHYPDMWGNHVDAELQADDNMIVLQRVSQTKYGSWTYENEWMTTYESSPNYPQQVN